MAKQKHRTGKNSKAGGKIARRHITRRIGSHQRAAQKRKQAGKPKSS